MVHVKGCMPEDLFSMQMVNSANLPENYPFFLYYSQLLSWPYLSFVAENDEGKVVGYVLSIIYDNDMKSRYGHISSLSVLGTQRKLGLAKKLMQHSHYAMNVIYKIKSSSLNVRESNKFALNLYKGIGYKEISKEHKYYGNGEDAIYMKYFFNSELSTG